MFLRVVIEMFMCSSSMIDTHTHEVWFETLPRRNDVFPPILFFPPQTCWNTEEFQNRQSECWKTDVSCVSYCHNFLSFRVCKILHGFDVSPMQRVHMGLLLALVCYWDLLRINITSLFLIGWSSMLSECVPLNYITHLSSWSLSGTLTQSSPGQKNNRQNRNGKILSCTMF